MSWFESWFDSPYYHILYQHRDETEAELFLDHLLEYLQPPMGSKMLDLGCGKGRHAVYLNEKGFEVTGIDLSEESINYCTQFENDKLSFFVHDMRKLFRVNDFDYVFNLFTSFGYFEKESENIASIKNACLALKKNGTLIIDYMNSDYVAKNLVQNDTVVADNIQFKITRELKDGYFNKDIYFSDIETEHHYVEKVAALKLADFEKYLALSNIKIKYVAGDYNLQKFDPVLSSRLIIVAIKE